METTALRQFLKSLCNASNWKYAVFWKLNHQRPMLLTWEDGYIEISEPVENNSYDFGFISNTNKTFYPKCETSVHEDGSSGCPITRAVADMSYLQYALGEGAVGKAAYTGNHCWWFSDDTCAGKVNSNSELPDDWPLQFVGGIKTILLLPVIPHGVLQLGSKEMVVEDPALVTFVKHRFSTIKDDFSMPFTSSCNLVAQPSSLFMSGSLEKLNDSLVITQCKPNRDELVDLMADDAVSISSQFSTTNQVRSLFTVQNAIHPSGKNMDILNGESENAVDISSVELVKEFKRPYLEKESLRLFQCNNFKEVVGGESSDRNTKIYSDSDMIEELYVDDNSGYADLTSTSKFLSFPFESELDKALGPSFQRLTDEYMWGSPVTGTGACSSSSMIFNNDVINSAGLLAWESTERSSKTDADNLLDAVVAGLFSGSDDTFPERSNCARIFESSSEAHNLSKSKAILGYDDSDPWSHMTSTYASQGRDTFTNFQATKTLIRSVMSGLTDDQPQNKWYDSVQTRKGAKLSKLSRRRSRPCDNQRPRPRDRQMIQDRVKELRELVPNGAKCSIDGLLERTIKHMLFLRSVSDRAEKFSQWTHQEAVGSKDWKSSETKEAGENGTSWAFQLGNELEVCPIVVEDLEYPGHILIEMLCNKHGLFLEIAQVIRGFELTILEGKIENRSNSTWSRFIVEVPLGFHRMDIFLPLLHLLQRNQHPISSKI